MQCKLRGVKGVADCCMFVISVTDVSAGNNAICVVVGSNVCGLCNFILLIAL